MKAIIHDKRKQKKAVKAARELYLENLSGYRRNFKTKMGNNEISQEYVAKETGKSQPLVSKMLKGERFNYDIFVYLKELPINLEV